MATTFNKVMTWLGLTEGPYDDDYDLPPEPETAPPRRDRLTVEPAVRQERSNVRTIVPPRAAEDDSRQRSDSVGTASRAVAATKVHLTSPTTFNDVEEIGMHFRDEVPVIMNLAGATEGVAKRLLDFASGLIFGLDGRIERVGDRVFLLTPANVEVSSEERRRLTERGFFNQA